ncbi:hypothetical protein CS022_20415 [Veronia nyctiphanis]|uniref:Uncharacterized protein n=1 Tax=Veronia nyctiphanis TaxID=1278244 RepID=A0A4Q0YNQ4_9GAMM|nr:hypothetical protein [Veronia nyctiphanis]RXJ71574.1 hypothetical protein CS022_20415 [Veronia nyctiphanis]
MRKLLAQFVKRRQNGATFINTENESPRWLPNGHVYYLLSTLKLRYQSKSGLVTLEQIQEENLASLLRELSESECVCPKPVSNIPSIYSLTVCGVCWEECLGKVRVKAIPEAAVLRFEHVDYQRSEARFQTSFHKCDDASLSLAERGNFVPTIKKVHNVNYQEFIDILKEINGSVPAILSDAVPVCSSNFDEPFTSSDKLALEQAVPGLLPSHL